MAARITLKYKHKLDATRDALFLQYGPRESLWLQKLAPGDVIVCCYRCRRVFYGDDWNPGCPLCKSDEPLYFMSANQLLLQEIAGDDGESVSGTRLRAMRAVRPADSSGDERETRLWEEELAMLKKDREDALVSLANEIKAARTPDMPSACAGLIAFAALSAVNFAARLIMRIA